MAGNRPIDRMDEVLFESDMYTVHPTTYFPVDDDASYGEEGYCIYRKEDGVCQARLPAFAQCIASIQTYESAEDFAKAYEQARAAKEGTQGLMTHEGDDDEDSVDPSDFEDDEI